MEKSILIDAGLTKKESEIFLLLTQKGASLASSIAKNTDISRPHVYDTLATLIEKGLVGYVIKNNRKYFKAAPPEQLLNYINGEKLKLEKKEQNIAKIIPELKKLTNPKKTTLSVEVYEGKEGFKSIFKDIISEKKNFVAFGASGKFEKMLPVFSQIFIKKREQLGIKGKLIVVEGVKPAQSSQNQYRRIPKQYASPSTTVVYGSKVAIFLWHDPLIGILINNKETARSYRHYFELLWKNAIK